MVQSAKTAVPLPVTTLLQVRAFNNINDSTEGNILQTLSAHEYNMALFKVLAAAVQLRAKFKGLPCQTRLYKFTHFCDFEILTGENYYATLVDQPQLWQREDQSETGVARSTRQATSVCRNV